MATVHSRAGEVARAAKVRTRIVKATDKLAKALETFEAADRAWRAIGQPTPREGYYASRARFPEYWKVCETWYALKARKRDIAKLEHQLWIHDTHVGVFDQGKLEQRRAALATITPLDSRFAERVRVALEDLTPLI
jgi:hypothetical protein